MMLIKSALELGKAIKLSRKQKKMSQSELADKVGTSQRWISEIENGKNRAQIGLVLKCMRILEIKLDAQLNASHISKKSVKSNSNNLQIKSFIKNTRTDK